MKDLISVIVPIYNVEKYLTKCLDSIINQTYKNLEIILVDDGSLDNCPKICDDYAKKDKRIRVIHKGNGGVSVARNMAISVAKGNYITFVDGDDFIDLDMYEKMINKIKLDNSDVCICGFNKVYDNSTEIVVEENLKNLNYEKLLIGFISNETSKKDNIIYTNNIMGSTCRVLYSRGIINSHRFIEDLAYCEDLLFNLEVLTEHIKISVLFENLYNYVQHATSFVHTTSIKKLEMQNRVITLIDNFYRDKNIDKKFLQAYKFLIYEFMFNEVIRSKDEKMYKFFIQNDNIQKLNNKENYKAKQQTTKSIVYKIANFFIHKKCFKFYNFCYKLLKK